MAQRKEQDGDAAAPAIVATTVAAPAEDAPPALIQLIEFCRTVAEDAPAELLSVFYDRERTAGRIWATPAEFAARLAAFSDEPSG